MKHTAAAASAAAAAARRRRRPPPLMTLPLHGRGRSVRRAARARLAVMATDTRLLVVACPCSLHSVNLLRPLPRSEAAF